MLTLDYITQFRVLYEQHVKWSMSHWKVMAVQGMSESKIHMMDWLQFSTEGL